MIMFLPPQVLSLGFLRLHALTLLFLFFYFFVHAVCRMGIKAVTISDFITRLSWPKEFTKTATVLQYLLIITKNNYSVDQIQL